ncbi:MAG: DUF1800 domain-containing protein [Proteobacteria bacterium]|nr:DUF1800 domain-containing protein [Pseudomonadota bacterium]
MKPSAALARFGLGARPGEFAAASSAGVRRHLAHQLAGPPDRPQFMTDLPPSHRTVAEFAALRKGSDKDKRRFRRQARELLRREARARIQAAVDSDRPFVERLVAFWSDHFTASALKPEVLAIAGAFEREAIRPNVLGTFEDLLLAVTRHPGMQLYLDNARSTGPNSRAGLRRGRGLNENLAREILELHTLGVDGGYSQDDVIGLARILTGWGLERGRGRGAGPTGHFGFHPGRHEPGAKTLLGTRYGEGYDEGVRALRDLAAHPSTARYVASELVRHFGADEPDPGGVAAVASVFERTGGDLRAVSEALLDLAGEPKLRTPWDLTVAAGRALEVDSVGCRALLRGLDHLGQSPWTAPSPAGWPDDAAGWAGPEAVVRRVEWAQEAGRRFGRDVDAVSLGVDVLGSRLRPTTRKHLVRAADDPATSVALLLASPEFQRR